MDFCESYDFSRSGNLYQTTTRLTYWVVLTCLLGHATYRDALVL